MVLTILSGCTSLPQVPAGVHPQPWHRSSGWFQPSCSSWSFSGKIGVRYHHHGTVAFLDWSHQKQTWDLDLSGPLNQNPLQIHGDTMQVQLQDATGHIWQAPGPDKLIQKAFGIELPASSLLDWMAGRPHQSSAQVWWDQNQNLAGMIDGSYQILYTQYHSEGPFMLPRRIDVSGPQLHLTLIVQAWTISSQCHPQL